MNRGPHTRAKKKQIDKEERAIKNRKHVYDKLRAHNRNVLATRLKSTPATPKKLQPAEFAVGKLKQFCQHYTWFQEMYNEAILKVMSGRKVHRFYRTQYDDSDGSSKILAYKIQKVTSRGDLVVSQYSVDKKYFDTTWRTKTDTFKQSFKKSQRSLNYATERLFDLPLQEDVIDVPRIQRKAQQFKKKSDEFSNLAKMEFQTLTVTSEKTTVFLPVSNRTCPPKCKTCGQLALSAASQEPRPMSLDDDDGLPENTDDPEKETFKEYEPFITKHSLALWMQKLFSLQRKFSKELEQLLDKIPQWEATKEILQVGPYLIRKIMGIDKETFFYEIKREPTASNQELCLQMPALKNLQETIKFELPLKHLTLLVLYYTRNIQYRQLFVWNESEKEWQHDQPISENPTEGRARLVNSTIVSFTDALFALGGFKVTVSRGRQQIQAIRTIQIYDRKNLEWKRCTTKLSVPRNGASAVVRGRQLIVTGGRSTEDIPLSSTEAFRISYDRDSKMFKLKEHESFGWMNELNEPRNLHACVLWKDTVCVVGGKGKKKSNGRKVILQSLELLDPSTDRWSLQDNKMEVPRSAFAAAVLGNKLYVMGGLFGDTDIILNSVECYDFEKKNWEKVKPMKYRRTHCEAAVWKGRIFVFGGNTYADKNLNTYTEEKISKLVRGEELHDEHFCAQVESFDPENGEWVVEEAYRLPSYRGRQNHAINPTFAGVWF